MKLSNIIEDFINEMLREANGGEIELKRNALAEKFSCVPSQINYVITTRFSPEREGIWLKAEEAAADILELLPLPAETKVLN